MELKQIEYFLTAAKLRNITKTAEYHYVSQPNVTTAIKRLEEELGVTLFYRKRTGLDLTIEGEYFFKSAQSALSILRNSVTELKDMKDKNSCEIKIGIPPMIGSFLFAPIINNFKDIFSDVKLTVVEAGSLGLQSKLIGGEIDLAILIINDSPEDLSTIPLIEKQHNVCLPLSHPLSVKHKILWSDLENVPLILMKEDSFHRHEIENQFRMKKIKPNIFISSNDIQTNLSMVSNGDGVSFMLDIVPVDESKIKMLSMDEPLRVKIGIAWNKDKYLTNNTRLLIDFINKFVPEYLK